MNRHSAKTLALTALVAIILPSVVRTQTDSPTRSLAREIFKQLIEINTTDSVGNTTEATDAVAQRLRANGFAASDVVVLGPNPRKGNMVARLHGAGKHRPVLLIGHLDVVEALRSDWTTDPFQLVEKDGYFYGRGTEDMKGDDSVWITEFIRLQARRVYPRPRLDSGAAPPRRRGRHVKWHRLAVEESHRELIDAEFVLNSDGGGIDTRDGKPKIVSMDASEKLYADYQLKGHQPRRSQFTA